MSQVMFATIETVAELRGEKISVSAGAALYAGDRSPAFDELYAVAYNAMYSGKRISGNSLTINTI